MTEIWQERELRGLPEKVVVVLCWATFSNFPEVGPSGRAAFPLLNRTPNRMLNPEMSCSNEMLPMKNAPRFLYRALVGLLVATVGNFAQANELPADQVEFFEKKIRPVLAEACYECHNSIEKKKGGVALDWRDALIESDVIVPGDPEASVLMASIRHEEGFEPMPDKKPKLSKLTIRQFEEWIRMGAPDPREKKPTKEDLENQVDWTAVREQRTEWWSFQPIADPEVPSVDDPEWKGSDVDRFVYAKLQEAGIEPQSTASPEVLVRRLHLILTGLPPTPGVVDSFSADPSPRAYEDLVDTLLASEAFGERWGRYWLDWFRYAESHGSEGDPPVPYATIYRDYVIRALNEDVPYDQLLREAVAGDLLDQPRVNEELGLNESAIGPAHFRMVPHGFGVTDAYDEQIIFTDNQVDVLTKATLGMTLSCARCHNHKFDPLSQEDFYKMYGILISSRPGVINVDSPELQALHREELGAKKPAIREAFADLWLSRVDEAIEALENADRAELSEAATKDETHPFHPWIKLRNGKGEEIGREWKALQQRHQDRLKQKAERIEMAAFYADLREQETYDRWFRNGTGLGEEVASAGSFAIAPEGDEALTGIYPRGIYSHLVTDKDNATLQSVFHLAEGNSALIRATGSNAFGRLVVRSYPLIHGGLHPAPALTDSFQWINQKKYSYWNGEQVYFQLNTGPDQTAKATNGRAWFGVTEVYGGEEPIPNVGTPAVALPGELPRVVDRESLLEFYHVALRDALAAWKEAATTDEQAALIDAFRRHDLLPSKLAALPEDLRGMIEGYREQEREIREPVRAPGVIEGQPWEQPFLVQGNYRNEEEPVARGFLEVFGAPVYPKEASGRRELAEDLVSQENTLVTRVLVNRLWHHVFGRGLVESTDNFGRLGKPPTHPELLDHLAMRFREEDDWSLKSAIRRLVTSRAFRSASVAPPEVAEKDPENLLHSYYSPRRLDAEAIRDTIGFVSGSLAERAVYRRQKRNSLDPFLAAFNYPIPTTTVGVRDSTNVPAQSLMLLNNSTVQQAANRWRDRILKDRSLTTDEARIVRLFEQGYSRKPTDAELQACLAFLEAKPDIGAILQLSEAVERAREDIAGLEQRKSALVRPVRDRLQAAADQRNEVRKKEAGTESIDLKPIARWDFEEDLRDSIGGRNARILGEAEVRGGALVLAGGCVLTDPIGKDLEAKSMEVLVQLDDLDQRGGGAITVQTLNGATFDSIVFAEIGSREWLAGSNNHARTLPFEGPAETLSEEEPVRMILVYEADGTTRAYRNGKPYGEPIRKRELQAFRGEDTQVAFGIRHGTGPGGNRMLRGKVFEAHLYDRALTPEEVAAASSGQLLEVVTEEQVLTALDPATREKVDGLAEQIAKMEADASKLTRRLAAEQKAQGSLSDGFARLAHALLNSKELIYVH